MARVNSIGMDELLDSIVRERKATPATMKKMIEAAGDVYVQETKNQIFLYGVVDKGVTVDSIKRGSVGKRRDGYRLEVWPAGMRVDKKHPRGERIETIAFVTEYGWDSSKGHVAARPFMATAAKLAPPQADEAMIDVWERESKL